MDFILFATGRNVSFDHRQNTSLGGLDATSRRDGGQTPHGSQTPRSIGRFQLRLQELDGIKIEARDGCLRLGHARGARAFARAVTLLYTAPAARGPARAQLCLPEASSCLGGLTRKPRRRQLSALLAARGR